MIGVRHTLSCCSSLAWAVESPNKAWCTLLLSSGYVISQSVHTGLYCHWTGQLPPPGFMSTGDSVGSASAQTGVLRVCFIFGLGIRMSEPTVELSGAVHL